MNIITEHKQQFIDKKNHRDNKNVTLKHYEVEYQILLELLVKVGPKLITPCHGIYDIVPLLEFNLCSTFTKMVPKHFVSVESSSPSYKISY